MCYLLCQRTLRIENEPVIEAFGGIKLLKFEGVFDFCRNSLQTNFLPHHLIFTSPTIIAYKSKNSICGVLNKNFPSVKLWHFVIPEPLQEATLYFYLTFNVLQLLKNYSLSSKTEENQSLPNIISNKYVCLYFPREVTRNTDNEQLFDRQMCQPILDKAKCKIRNWKHFIISYNNLILNVQLILPKFWSLWEGKRTINMAGRKHCTPFLRTIISCKKLYFLILFYVNFQIEFQLKWIMNDHKEKILD